MRFSFTANVWLYPGTSAAWHFISLPKRESEIVKKEQDRRQVQGKKRRGWGAVKVRVAIGKTSWTTSIFPDKKSGTYLLPLKAGVRKKEGIAAKDAIKVSVNLL